MTHPNSQRMIVRVKPEKKYRRKNKSRSIKKGGDNTVTATKDKSIFTLRVNERIPYIDDQEYLKTELLNHRTYISIPNIVFEMYNYNCTLIEPDDNTIKFVFMYKGPYVKNISVIGKEDTYNADKSSGISFEIICTTADSKIVNITLNGDIIKIDHFENTDKIKTAELKNYENQQITELNLTNVSLQTLLFSLKKKWKESIKESLSKIYSKMFQSKKKGNEIVTEAFKEFDEISASS